MAKSKKLLDAVIKLLPKKHRKIARATHEITTWLWNQHTTNNHPPPPENDGEEVEPDAILDTDNTVIYRRKKT